MKKNLSFISALSAAVMLVQPLAGNAVFYAPEEGDTLDISGVQINSHSFYEGMCSGTEPREFYSNGSLNTDITVVSTANNQIHIRLKDDSTKAELDELVEKYSQEYGKEFKLNPYWNEDFYSLDIISPGQYDELNITNEMAKELMELFSEKADLIESMTFHNNMKFKEEIKNNGSIMNYMRTSVEKVDAYLKEAGYDYEFADEGFSQKLQVPENMTTQDALDLANEIYENTGESIFGMILADNPTPVDLGYIDLLSYTEGDANCDGEAKIGDAVAVLQSIALPDKYALTEQGKFNADIDCNGITASDAIAIQKMDAER